MVSTRSREYIDPPRRRTMTAPDGHIPVVEEVGETNSVGADAQTLRALQDGQRQFLEMQKQLFAAFTVDTPIWPNDYFRSHLRDHPDDEMDTMIAD
ncbi:hypothetical protein RHMOL_Rhmol01G0183100 [Rhododendron molle]|uniref:Uncharacterized protein n=1 Tax=Rhododendron molle TaxID=49168 RepID=A0ACC0Q5I7_RHOML|nr:hypothetical protein RHMOL_Rhmol01G0183100 [Rhododendron molle]